MIALEAMAGDPELRRERVQLVEADVAGHVAPVLERQLHVLVRHQLVDHHGHQAGSVGPQRRTSLITKSEPPGTSLLETILASFQRPIAPIRSMPRKRSSELRSAT